MERVLLAYDGGPAAESALDWVTDRALQRPIMVDLVLTGTLAGSAQADRVLELAERRLHTRIPGIPVETHRLGGAALTVLSGAAARADALVVGVDDNHPFRSAVHGWVSQRVGASSPVPTYIIPTGWSPTPGHVTVGLDDDTSSDAAVAYAAVEAFLSGVDLRIVHAWSSQMTVEGAEGPTTTRGQIAAQHLDLVERTVQRLREQYPNLDAEVDMPQDDPVAALAAAARKSVLVVIGTHGRGILAGGFFGSVALDLIGLVATPICVVPSTS